MTDAHAWIAERLPRDRDLERQELIDLARSVGEHPKLWQSLVRHDANMRYYTELYRDTHLDVWLICWLDDQKTGLHDHDLSSGAVYVCSGAITEDRFQLHGDGFVFSTREHPAGECFDFDAAYIHGLRHAGGPPATSIHCYSPPLWRMGYYEPDQKGALCRTSMTYLEEVSEAHSH